MLRPVMRFGRFLLTAILLLLAVLNATSAPAPTRTMGPQGPVVSSSRPALQAPSGALEAPKNVILFIGDGMGSGHVEATSLYLGRPLIFESFPYSTTMTTNSTQGVTDSAAAATAMATGRRVNNGVISMAIPGTGEELTSTLDLWQAAGNRAGLVTTSSIDDASPAAFAAHEPTRENRTEIASDYFEQSRPNVLMGGAGDGVTETLAEAAGYTVVGDTTELLALDVGAVTHLSGQFGEGHMPPINHGREPLPTLAQMTETALHLLEDGPNGFFLMVEQEGTDTYSHGNDLELMVDAATEMEAAVEVALEWAGTEGDTMIIVTADHETGGLVVEQDNGPGELPDVRWTAGSRHTASPVPLYASGPGAGRVTAIADITELHAILNPVHRLYLPLALHTSSPSFTFSFALPRDPPDDARPLPTYHSGPAHASPNPRARSTYALICATPTSYISCRSPCCW